MKILRLITFLGIIGSLAASAGAFEPDKDVLVSLRKGAVLVTVPKGAHLNKAMTRVTLTSKGGPVKLGPLPPANGKDEQGEEIYRGTLRIPIVGGDPAGELHLEVRYQVCTEGADGNCFLPLTRELLIPDQGAAARK